MGNRRTKTTGVKSCTCDKCNLSLLSVAGKRHRRCGGTDGAPIKAKHSPASGVRGFWR